MLWCASGRRWRAGRWRCPGAARRGGGQRGASALGSAALQRRPRSQLRLSWWYSCCLLLYQVHTLWLQEGSMCSSTCVHQESPSLVRQPEARERAPRNGTDGLCLRQCKLRSQVIPILSQILFGAS